MQWIDGLQAARLPQRLTAMHPEYVQALRTGMRVGSPLVTTTQARTEVVHAVCC